MTRTLTRSTTPRYRELPDTGRRDQPLGLFLTESLLTARAGSMFPTNGAGPDEDVNVYLAHLLAGMLTAGHSPQVSARGTPLFCPPARTATPAARADYYRANADHRLLYLGLFGRGDGLRHRTVLYGLSVAETRQRDLAAGQTCYAAAASHARPRTASERALVEIWCKLADHFADYVHVMAVLATRHLGLGAHLSDADLARLTPAVAADDAQAVAQLLQSPPPPAALDVFLDLWLAQKKNPDPLTTNRMREMANRLGVQLMTDTADNP